MDIVTRIDRVTLFRHGALVTRVGALPESLQGPVQLRIPGLPLLFNAESLRARVVGPGIVSSRLGPLEERPELEVRAEEIGADEEEERALLLRRADTEERLSAWRRLDALCERLAPPGSLDLAPLSPARPPPREALAALTDLVCERRERIAQEVARFEDRLLEIDREQEALRRRASLAPAREARPARYTRTVETTFEGSLNGTAVFEIETFIAGARWAPVYEIFVDEAAGFSTLSLHAMVAQATGEDWHDVALSFSTVDLRRETRMGRLASWRLGRAAPPPPPAWRPLPEDGDTLFREWDEFSKARTRAREAPARRKKARREPPAEAMPSGASFGAADDGVPMPAPCSPPPRPMAPEAMMARTARAPSPVLSAGMAKLEEARACREEAVLVEEPLPPPAPRPSLDYAWLRLGPWEDPARRGRLWPVDLSSDLLAMIEERAGNTASWEELERALAELRKRQHALHSGRLPPGCVSLSDASFYHRYAAGPRVSVPEDGRYHQVRVAEVRAPHRVLLRIVPRQDTRAWRFLRLDNPLRAPLAAGPLRVHVDGAFVAQGSLPSVGAGGTLHLGLGVEEGLRVARHVTFVEHEKGLLSSSMALEHGVRIELRSNLPRAASVEVFERLPLAADQPEVDVSLDETSPVPVRDLGPEGHRLDGALKWTLSLPPNEATTLRYRYTVRIPAKKELIGGNRREP